MTDQKLLVVVEGQTDAEIVRAILGDELKSKTRFFSGQGKMGLATIGRNLLVHEGGPVLVVMDSDTLDIEQSEEQKALVNYAMASVASGAVFSVFAFRPTIEVVLFEAPRALERLLGKPVPPETIREGCLLPKQTLVTLVQEAEKRHQNCSLFDIAPEVGSELGKGPQAAALIDNVRAMVTSPVELAG